MHFFSVPLPKTETYKRNLRVIGSSHHLEECRLPWNAQNPNICQMQTRNVFLFCCRSSSNAGWCTQNPLPLPIIIILVRCPIWGTCRRRRAVSRYTTHYFPVIFIHQTTDKMKMTMYSIVKRADYFWFLHLFFLKEYVGILERWRKKCRNLFCLQRVFFYC